MERNPVSRSGISNSRLLAAIALCAGGFLLGALSLAAPPDKAARVHLAAPPYLADFPGISATGNQANQLTPGVPLPPGMEQAETPESRLLEAEDQSDWSIVSSPNSSLTPANNFPYGVTCLSTSDCWAVGFYNSTASTFQTLIQHWDGTSWTIVESPNSSPTQNNLLRGVTCVSASDCWAVGSYYDGSFQQTLTQHWNGTDWAIVASPTSSAIQYNYLFNVTCTASADCWAVGYHSAGSGFQTLIERWNGTAWTVVASPNAAGSQSFLSDIKCASGSDCWTVGYYVNSTTSFNQTLIERWNGTAWAIVTSPNALLSTHNYLYGMTCATATDCWAVGSSFNGSAQQTLIERWNGTSWAVISSPNTSATQSNVLSSVTCASALECWAAGNYSLGGITQTLTEHWNGTGWAIVTSPNTSVAQNNTLGRVTCVAASDCWAVGYYDSGAAEQALMERWNGSAWAIVATPNINAAQNNTLLGVTCAAASDCWAVSSFYNGSVQQTLIEHWDGTSWTIVTSPNTSTTQSNILYSVTCVTGSDCWAIGYANNGIAFQSLTVHWDGSSWNIVASPNPAGSQNNFLNSVTCVSTSDCWAVGFYDTGSSYQTLIEHWNGTSWTIVSSPNTSASQQNRLYGVTCASASNCWAVGRYFNDVVQQTLIEHWDGSSWAIVTSPNTSTTQENYLWSVTCSSASNCWAIGSHGSGAGDGETLIEHWNGTAWSIAMSPNPTSQNNYIFLRGVTCASAAQCWAVGYYFNDGAYRTLIERWDGTSWAVVSSPNTSATQYNYLIGVTCVSTSNCWAAGYSTSDAGIFRTLIEHYTVSLPPVPSNAVSRLTHSGVADFDVNLPFTGDPGIECRSGGVNGEYTIVTSFATPVTVTSASLTSGAGGTGSISGSPTVNGNIVTVYLTGVSNAQTLVVHLLGVSDGTNNGDVPVPMAVLLGDTNADRSVNSADISQTKSQSGNPVSISNFREDVTVDGNLNSADISLVKSQSGTALP